MLVRRCGKIRNLYIKPRRQHNTRLLTKGRFMFDMLIGMFCFVTAAVSFLYGTRICWVCGKACTFATEPDKKRQILKAKMPAGFAVYSFGFIVVFSCILDGAVTISLLSLTSSLILTHFMTSMAMPELKRPPSNHTNRPS